VQKPFPRVRYEEAIALLTESGKPVAFGDDLGGDEETVLSERFDRPVMVHRYPAASKAFYMKHDPADPRLALCVDVLAPEGYGEIIGGGQREDDLTALAARIQEHGLRRRHSAGTSTSGATARSRTPGSAWGSSGWSRGSAACTTSAKPSRFRACWSALNALTREFSLDRSWAAGRRPGNPCRLPLTSNGSKHPTTETFVRRYLRARRPVVLTGRDRWMGAAARVDVRKTSPRATATRR
jgi:hypothetical protein